MTNSFDLRRLLPMLLLLLLSTVTGCQQSRTVPAPAVLTGETQGTTYSVRFIEHPHGVGTEAVQAEINAALACIDVWMSNWNPDSEVSRFNQYQGTDWFAVSPETSHVVAAAIDMSRQSDGAFDVTVGPLVKLWGFGSAPDQHDVPSDAEIQAALRHVGWREIESRTNPPALRKARADIQLDLSGIAQGFSVDYVARLLSARGVDSYLAEIGGEVRTAGRKADGTAWRVGIERPSFEAAAPRALHRAVELIDSSLATSGDYRHYREVDGRRFSHTIDPRTGRCVEHQLASVSVIADDCMRADATATALMVLGPDDGYAWAVEHNVAALLLIREGEALSERATPEFVRLAGD